MARLSGVDLARDKRIEIAQTYVYGIGRTRANDALAATGVSPDIRARDVLDEDPVKLRDYADEYFKVEGDLRREIAAGVRRKIEIGSYQGIHIAAVCRAMGSGPKRMPEPRRVPRKQSRARKAGKKRAGRRVGWPSVTVRLRTLHHWSG